MVDLQFIFNILIGLAIFTFVFVFGIASFIFYLYNRRKRNREERSLASVLLEVKVPRSNEIKIDAMEQLVGALYSIKEGGWKNKFKSQPVISFEIVAKPGMITFYIWCHKEHREIIEKQVHGAYPDAELAEVPEYEIFGFEGKVAYKSYQLKKDTYFPIKTYKEMPTDPLSTITSALSKMSDGEAAAIQILISPVDNAWSASGRSYISSTKKSEADPEKTSYGSSGKKLEFVENKISKPGFETSIRVIVVSPFEANARAHLANIDSAFALFASESNSIGSRKVRRKSSFVEDFLYRYHAMFHLFGNKAMVMNNEEIASLFHFPNKLIVTPHIQWLMAKSAPAPANIPSSGLFIGKNSFRGTTKPVYIAEKDRLRHLYIIGKTGTGKSKFLMELMKQDIRNGDGMCFMDPHGDAVEELLQFVPPERAEDVVYFRPSDVARPMGLNLLEAKTEDQKHFVATSVINMMYKLFDPYKTGIIGPRFEHAVRNAVLTVLAVPGNTFIEVMRILTDSEFVKEMLPHVTDPIVRRYWTDQIAQTSDFHKSETLDYITSKFGRFVTNTMIRNIIGQSYSSFDFRDVMDNRKLLLINLSKGELGEENSSFLGLIIVPRILMAAMSRTDIPEDQRKPFYLYVDEFQNFATPDFAQILSEARKYKLSLTVANQFIGQIDEEIKNAIFGNVGTIMSYRVGVTDAGYLQKEFAPVFNEEDLQNIERYHVYMKTLVDNDPVPAFSVDLTKDMNEVNQGKNPQVAQIVQEMSRLKFGRDLKLVEHEIVTRSKL